MTPLVLTLPLGAPGCRTTSDLLVPCRAAWLSPADAARLDRGPLHYVEPVEEHGLFCARVGAHTPEARERAFDALYEAASNITRADLLRSGWTEQTHPVLGPVLARGAVLLAVEPRGDRTGWVLWRAGELPVWLAEGDEATESAALLAALSTR